MDEDFRIEKLKAHHDRGAFQCGNEALDLFLQRQARQNADRNIGVTHVVVSQPSDPEILAYYTLVTKTVDSAIVPLKKLPRGPIGVVLLGRLAVSIKWQGRGLGQICILKAMDQTARAAEEIGIFALVVDAIDERARKWYLGLDLGFEALLDDPNHLYLPIETIRASLQEE